MKDIWKPEWDELIATAYGNVSAGVKKSESTQEIDHVFAEILSLWVGSMKVKDTWKFYPGHQENSWCYLGQARSKKLQESFNFGFYEGKLFLDVSFVHPYRLKYMGDDFWEHLIELNKCGDCKFSENAGLAGDEGKLLEKYSSSKSNIFNIVKNYLLLEMHGGGSGDLGGVEVLWPMDVDREELLLNGATALFHMYKMNYLLYRSYSQYLNGLKKRS